MGFMFELFVTILAAVICINIGKVVCQRAGSICTALINGLFDGIEKKFASKKAKGV